jgi:hypothetical protein
MPSERVRDTFVQRYDLAKYVGPQPRLLILGTTEDVSGRLQRYSLTRIAPARSWPRRSSSGTSAGPCFGTAAGVVRKLAIGLETIRRCLLGDIEASEV